MSPPAQDPSQEGGDNANNLPEDSEGPGLEPVGEPQDDVHAAIV